uniref:Ubiquitin-protein ligase n=1 Tax=Candidatus Kentrum sp. FM TaxID=2126340 RepID=A0A450VVE9_9GAMM|nr:MAG: Ubiquitin-protein ligase [Candidatus Kentron sp. FM]VFJ50757.1 MAG: Ubiquitin-protein ligase [Candidatus Kentron sp. FM]VFK08754.1 MAG: Ubiquitin-protein ligase [Candidatus Kentron sp. FM]
MPKIFVEAPSGERFGADIRDDTKFSKIAADFFEAQGWPEQDSKGRGQRAVVELTNQDNPDDTKRLDGEQSIGESGVRDGDTLRIFPESIAGAGSVDQKARLMALTTDHRDMQEIIERNPKISFTANRAHAPDLYTVTFHLASFTDLPPGTLEPRQSDTHRIEITLGADYPRKAPLVRWLTPIFHPNIRQTNPPKREDGHGLVCLGVLQHRYLPGLGLARLVTMLFEMAQWRNFDAFDSFNPEASRWAIKPENWQIIERIGGHPLQGPIGDLLKKLERATQSRISFTPAT